MLILPRRTSNQGKDIYSRCMIVSGPHLKGPSCVSTDWRWYLNNDLERPFLYTTTAPKKNTSFPSAVIRENRIVLRILNRNVTPFKWDLGESPEWEAEENMGMRF